MKVQLRKSRKPEKKAEEILAEKEVARQLFLPPFEVEYRGPLEKGYYFTILADGEIVGRIGLERPSRCRSTYSVCFYVSQDYWGKGIATEALKQVVKFAFDELRIHKICGDNDSDNPASGRVMEKAGFKREGVLKEHWFKEGRYIDIIHWGIIRK